MNEVTYIFAGNIELDVEFTYVGGIPAKIDALPEDCYPAEDEEIEIQSITCNGESVETDDLYLSIKGEMVWIDEDIKEFISTNREQWMDEEFNPNERG